ncbi:hypothetical protein JTB14_008083 [Gonioctena quinquepunctata]|nr:hypothetical protein JTB14_008083 [Gonioctena quinquepunctata]
MVEYRIQDNQLPALAEGQAYEHLGIPTGYHVDQSPEDTIDALSTFILPKIWFVLRGCQVQKNPLKVLDNKVKKACLNLPQRASRELLYVPMKKGGAGVLPMADLVEVASIVQALSNVSLDNGPGIQDVDIPRVFSS